MACQAKILTLAILLGIGAQASASTGVSSAITARTAMTFAVCEAGDIFKRQQATCSNPLDKVCAVNGNSITCANVCCTFGGKFLGGCQAGTSCIISSSGVFGGCCQGADPSLCTGPIAPCANANQPVKSPTVPCPSATPSCVTIGGLPACTGTLGEILPPPTSAPSTPSSSTSTTLPPSTTLPSSTTLPPLTTVPSSTTLPPTTVPSSTPPPFTSSFVPGTNHSSPSSSPPLQVTSEAPRATIRLMGTFVVGIMVLALSL